MTYSSIKKALEQELRTCIEHKDRMSGAEQPILLGDFIVASYNRYLNAAREICEDPVLQNVPLFPNDGTGFLQNRLRITDCQGQGEHSANPAILMSENPLFRSRFRMATIR